MTSSVTAPTRRRQRRARTWVNWALAVLTAPAAAVVMVVGLGGVMSMAACSTAECPNLGPSGVVFNVLFYGAAVVAAVTIVLSIFTATRRHGIIVPVCGWALLLADVVAITVAFNT